MEVWPPLPTDPYPPPPTAPYPYAELPWEEHFGCPFCLEGIPMVVDSPIACSEVMDDLSTDVEEPPKPDLRRYALRLSEKRRKYR
jgi:hypothetical protein